MSRIIPLFLILIFSIQGLATKPGDTIDRSSFDAEFLAKLISKKINDIRLNKRRHSLDWNRQLQRAAQHHADYLMESGRFAHEQRNLRMRTPARRAEHFGFKNPFVGENIVLTWLDFIKGPSRARFGMELPTTYDEAADEAVRLWVKSRGHYKNMLVKGYYTTGVAVAVDKSTGKLIAVQVFGGRDSGSNL